MVATLSKFDKDLKESQLQTKRTIATCGGIRRTSSRRFASLLALHNCERSGSEVEVRPCLAIQRYTSSSGLTHIVHKASLSQV
ncbi:hypothetical protein JG687_00004661 [Phytophthora cactorum]|uniref:Uncharacterized protein n=1 Tax=Phytophthora cactorum TaxID=29920 RepID=A0A8T1UQH7_9STRA|nr:hypothetical protein JG687_00004661 [Phytophthora cactorum]